METCWKRASSKGKKKGEADSTIWKEGKKYTGRNTIDVIHVKRKDEDEEEERCDKIEHDNDGGGIEQRETRKKTTGNRWQVEKHEENKKLIVFFSIENCFVLSLNLISSLRFFFFRFAVFASSVRIENCKTIRRHLHIYLSGVGNVEKQCLLTWLRMSSHRDWRATIWKLFGCRRKRTMILSIVVRTHHWDETNMVQVLVCSSVCPFAFRVLLLLFRCIRDWIN